MPSVSRLRFHNVIRRHRLTTILLLATASVLSCDPLSESPWRFEDHDAAEPAIVRLFQLVRRPDRQEQGFSSLPTSGPISVSVNKPLRTPPPGWEEVTTSLHIQARRRSRAWYFGGSVEAPQFICETEAYHSSHLVTAPEFNNGNKFYEYVELQYAAKGSALWRQGYRVTHYGASGPQLIALQRAQDLAAEWGVFRGE
jgi:hypothetical protein